MQKYKQFVFKEFSKDAVVKSVLGSIDTAQNSAINDIVFDHFSKIINTDDHDKSNVSLVNDDNDVKSDNNSAPVPAFVDLENVKNDAYNDGYKDAEEEYKKQIDTLETELKSNKHFVDNIQEHLLSLDIKDGFDKYVDDFSANLLVQIAKQLHLVLPFNFESLLKQDFLELLRKYYKQSMVKIFVNPSKMDLCSKILESANLPETMRDKYQILDDSDLSQNDCRIEYADTRLEYNQDELSSEVNKILDQLKKNK
ncbi:MAG: FliH/SctL family protein [Rickettsiaceae bacterium]